MPRRRPSSARWVDQDQMRCDDDARENAVDHEHAVRDVLDLLAPDRCNAPELAGRGQDALATRAQTGVVLGAVERFRLDLEPLDDVPVLLHDVRTSKLAAQVERRLTDGDAVALEELHGTAEVVFRVSVLERDLSARLAVARASTMLPPSARSWR